MTSVVPTVTIYEVFLEQNISMADSIILAAAKEFNAILWTQDSDFKNISDVKYFPKK